MTLFIRKSFHGYFLTVRYANGSLEIVGYFSNDELKLMPA
jgi:hypothetical protein